MNQQAINKFLCEKVKGECWHKLEEESYPWDSRYGQVTFYRCKKCRVTRNKKDPLDYSSDSEYLPFLHWCQEQEWWKKFTRETFAFVSMMGSKTIGFILDPLKMLSAIAKWHGWKEER